MLGLNGFQQFVKWAAAQFTGALFISHELFLLMAPPWSRIQRDTPGYGPRRTEEELRRDLAAAKRYADK